MCRSTDINEFKDTNPTRVLLFTYDTGRLKQTAVIVIDLIFIKLCTYNMNHLKFNKFFVILVHRNRVEILLDEF